MTKSTSTNDFLTHAVDCDMGDDCTCGVREQEEAIAEAKALVAAGKKVNVKIPVEHYAALMRSGPAERLKYAKQVMREEEIKRKRRAEYEEKKAKAVAERKRKKKHARKNRVA
jgi:uncharacterized secreted protein with C-terminal beta-propeller domain